MQYMCISEMCLFWSPFLSCSSFGHTKNVLAVTNPDSSNDGLLLKNFGRRSSLQKSRSKQNSSVPKSSDPDHFTFGMQRKFKKKLIELNFSNLMLEKLFCKKLRGFLSQGSHTLLPQFCARGREGLSYL